jgi:hypothetical protein
MVQLKVQSVLLPKSKYKEKESDKWIKDHKYKIKKYIKNFKSTNFYRYRQLPPTHFKKSSFREKKLANGVILVLGTYIK